MRRALVAVNALAVGLTLAYLGWLLGDALRAGQPWAVTCYDCKACTARCVLGLDPQGFVSAALAGSGDVYMYATNVRLRARHALEIDPGMLVTVGDRHPTAREAAAELGPDAEVVTFRMRARDAARACFRCGACEKGCGLRLPLLRVITQLRGDASNEWASHAP
ncbi:hypothetical protein [Anaeromyxobacter dehalogenans]|uniref:4Fe-4S ferredoxin-type domain-containing protein n=1 Tax=Anaeromyxobacter dehalogenans (strain 2CP-C) TaxID=290397 RepID=Q2IMS9_ANADE|nr:hypothetical protein [Anaeromyxobacter dehalogenans]ABC80109.1 hypothetical protein Adeh_0333 [Anaeromyxobacter dehalogenans 2CP-C]